MSPPEVRSTLDHLSKVSLPVLVAFIFFFYSVALKGVWYASLGHQSIPSTRHCAWYIGSVGELYAE